jgi:cation diffusion facilitator family transporter
MSHDHSSRTPLHSFLWLSILAAVVTMALKLAAWAMTGSVGLLSDALESVVNLVAGVVAFLAVRYAGRPADSDHAYGHEKIEYFSSGIEGGMVLVAGLGIIWIAIPHFFKPEPLVLDLGLVLAALAAGINLAVALVLLRVGKARKSIALEADGHHLMTDVWTSVGVIAGLCLVWLTGWVVLDPILAILVAVVILWTGFDLMWRSFNGLMDRALPEAEMTLLRETVQSHLGPNMTFHALRTRQAGMRRFADFHLLVPGAMTVQASHDLANAIEGALARAMPELSVTIHIEPIEDRTSHEDIEVPEEVTRH